jgi:hypothetical protein
MSGRPTRLKRTRFERDGAEDGTAEEQPQRKVTSRAKKVVGDAGAGAGAAAPVPQDGGAEPGAVVEDLEDESLLEDQAAGVLGLEEALRGPYKSATLLDHTDVLAMALRIARHFEANFEDKEAVKRVSAIAKDVAEAQAAVAEAEAAGDSSVEALAAAKARLVSVSRSSETIGKNRMRIYRRNMRDSILRVTLEQGASTVNALAGDIAGEAFEVMKAGLRCGNCGNDTESSFLSDPKQADTICTVCGLVVADAALHDGDWTRSFEGEENTSQVGPPPDPLLSNRYNLRTGMALATGVPKVRMKALRIMAEAVEMGSGSSAAGLADKRTRLAYKDKMKLSARNALVAAAERLEMARPIADRASQLFAAFRDNREHVTAYEETLAGCLTAAYEESVHARLNSERNDRRQNRVDAEEEAREALLSAGSAPVPAAPLPTPAEVAAEEAARHKRETARAAVEEKRARALGLLGSTHMMDFDESSGGSDGESSEGEAPTASGGRVRDGGFRLAIGRAGMRAPMSAADSARIDALCDRASG